MSLMVACADAVFAQHEPLLRWLSSRLVRIGTRVGDGARTKLVNNLLAAVNLAGAAEALALGRTRGPRCRSARCSVIEQSSAQSWIGSDRMARALAGDFAPRAHTSLLAKDTTLALELARRAQVRAAARRGGAGVVRARLRRGAGVARRCQPADADAAPVRSAGGALRRQATGPVVVRQRRSAA